MQEIWTIAKRPCLSKNWMVEFVESLKTRVLRLASDTELWSDLSIFKSPKKHRLSQQSKDWTDRSWSKLHFRAYSWPKNIALKWQSINLWKGEKEDFNLPCTVGRCLKRSAIDKYPASSLQKRGKIEWNGPDVCALSATFFGISLPNSANRFSAIIQQGRSAAGGRNGQARIFCYFLVPTKVDL